MMALLYSSRPSKDYIGGKAVSEVFEIFTLIVETWFKRAELSKKKLGSKGRDLPDLSSIVYYSIAICNF